MTPELLFSECLLQAMSSVKDSPTLKESMALQHKAYLFQIDRLHAKSQLLELMNSKTTKTISRATQTDCLNHIEVTNGILLDEDSVYQILRENEDLMKRCHLKDCEKQDNIQISLSDDNSNISHKDESLSKLKLNQSLFNSDAPSKEEMIKVNEKLTKAVHSLLQELGSTKAEKKLMEEKLSDSQEMLKAGSNVLQFSTLDRPPLEVSYPELANFS